MANRKYQQLTSEHVDRLFKMFNLGVTEDLHVSGLHPRQAIDEELFTALRELQDKVKTVVKPTICLVHAVGRWDR